MLPQRQPDEEGEAERSVLSCAHSESEADYVGGFLNFTPKSNIKSIDPDALFII